MIYARYSADAWRAAAIEDAFGFCCGFIARQGRTLAPTDDALAVSGGSRLARGVRWLMSGAKTGTFEVMVCEASDRLGRKPAEVTGTSSHHIARTLNA